jgi:hypothetical protein
MLELVMMRKKKQWQQPFAKLKVDDGMTLMG